MNAAQRRAVHDAMVRLARGDRAAFDAVFFGLWNEILSFVRHALPGDPDAEDLAQQTLLKIFFRISDFDATRDGAAWAFGIAMYEVRTLRRTRHRRREVAEASARVAIEAASSPERLLIETDLMRALSGALGELSNRERAALLGDPEEPSLVSPAAWRKRRQRALDRLKAIWSGRHA